MSWRAVVFAALSDGEWHIARDLFAPIEKTIEAHYATRHMARMRGNATVVKITDVDVGRFRYFASYLYDLDIEIENGGARRQLNPLSRLRLRPAGRCPNCAGAVYRKTLRRHRGFCPACNDFCRWIPFAAAVAKRRMTPSEVLFWVYRDNKAHQRPVLTLPPVDAVEVHRLVSTFGHPWSLYLMAYGYTDWCPEMPRFRCQPAKWIRVTRRWNILWTRIGKDETMFDHECAIYVKWTPIKYVNMPGDDPLMVENKIYEYHNWYAALSVFSRLVKTLDLETIEVI